MVPLVIVGGGAHGRETLDVVEAINAENNRFTFIGFLADDYYDQELLERRGTPYLGDVATLAEIDAQYVIAIGSGSARRRIDELATAWGKTAAILVHPSSTMGFDVTLGPGSVVAAGVRLTTNVRLGRHVHVNTNSSVSHDSVLGSYVTLSPGVNVSGRVLVEQEVTLGTNAAVVPRVTIGARAVVGAGAAVIRDIPSDHLAVGVPARATKKLDVEDQPG